MKEFPVFLRFFSELVEKKMKEFPVFPYFSKLLKIMNDIFKFCRKKDERISFFSLFFKTCKDERILFFMNYQNLLKKDEKISFFHDFPKLVEKNERISVFPDFFQNLLKKDKTIFCVFFYS